MGDVVAWFGLTIFILFVLFMVVAAFYYKSIAQKERKESSHMKYTLVETEVLIQKHQLSLQRATLIACLPPSKVSFKNTSTTASATPAPITLSPKHSTFALLCFLATAAI